MSRSKWKGPYINVKNKDEITTLKKLQNNFLVASRNSEIIPKFLGLTFKTHNGQNYTEILITEEMIGHKFGEFSFTRSKYSFKKKKSKK